MRTTHRTCVVDLAVLRCVRRMCESALHAYIYIYIAGTYISAVMKKITYTDVCACCVRRSA